MSSPPIQAVLDNAAVARRAGNFGEASLHLNEALALCGPGREEDRGVVLRELGELARNQRDLDSAQTHYQSAVALLRGSPDQLKYAHTLRHLGDVNAEQHRWPEAEQCYIEVLDIYRKHPSPRPLDLANAIRYFAVLKIATGSRDEARALWAEAGKLYAAENIPVAVEECRRRVAELSERVAELGE